VTHFKQYFQRHDSTLHTSNNNSRDTTARDTLQTTLPETRQYVTHFKQYSRDTTVRDTLLTTFPETRQYVTHFKQHFQRHDSTWHTSNNTHIDMTVRDAFQTVLTDTDNCKRHFSHAPHTQWYPVGNYRYLTHVGASSNLTTPAALPGNVQAWGEAAWAPDTNRISVPFLKHFRPIYNLLFD